MLTALLASFAFPAVASASMRPDVLVNEVIVRPTADDARAGALIVTVSLQSDVPAAHWQVIGRASAGWTVAADATTGIPITLGPDDELSAPTFAIKATGQVPQELVLELEVVDRDRVYNGTIVRRYFELGDALREIKAAEYTSRKVTDQGGLLDVRPEGSDVVAPAELRHLAPQDNPQLSDKEKAAIAEHLAAKQQATAVAGGALRAADPGSAALSEASGCTGSQEASGAWLLLPVALGLGLLLRRRRGLVQVALFGVPAAIVALPHSARAESRTVYGYVSFWDTRNHRSDDTGSRLTVCDTSATTCTPSSGSTCCFTGIPLVTVELLRMTSPSTVVDTFTTTSTGVFVLTDDAWQNVEYRIAVRYARADEGPASFQIRGQTGDSYFTTVFSNIYLTGAYTYKPNLSVNAAGDTTSVAGDLASLWGHAYSALDALEWEGETRHRKNFGSANAYDLVVARYYDFAGASNASCDPSVIFIDYGAARDHTVPHELGHIYAGRVVGCNGGGIAYPQQVDDPQSWHTGEGQALQEGIASVTMALRYWNPATAAGTSLRANLFDCFVDTFNNTNHTSSERNNWLGMWELLDAEVTTNDGATDRPDRTMVEVMNGLVGLQNAVGTPGQNRTNAEAVFTSTGQGCWNSEDCAAGQVCFGDYSCRTGDPHGENIGDWIYHIAAELGVSETAYWQALVSSPCVGPADNTYPFTGGWRAD